MNKTFCPMPWIHLHPVPSGLVKLCCHSESDIAVGHLATNSLFEIANNETLNQIRKKMLNGEQVDQCKSCYFKEQVNLKSTRNYLCEQYDDKIEDFIKNTNTNGSLKTPWQLKIFNFRLSNLCNQSCRTCSSEYSSMIAQEKNLKRIVLNTVDYNINFFKEIISYLPGADEVWFVGGEPLLITEYWTILDELIKLGKTNIVIGMFTNLSKLEHNNKNIIEYLKQFPNHILKISIDDLGDKNNFLRNGSNWTKLHQNLLTLKNSCINYTIFPTVSAYNVFTLPDLEKFFVENNFIVNEKLEHNLLIYPTYLNCKILPTLFKKQIADKVNNHQNFLKENNLYKLADNWSRILEFLFTDDYSHLIPKFIEYNNNLDKLRGQNLFQTYPELLPILEFVAVV